MTWPTKVSIELRDIHTFVFLWHGLFVIERRQSSFETGDTSSCKKSIYGRWLLVPLDKYNDKAKGTCFTPPLFICNGQKSFFTIVTWIFWNRVTGPKKNLSKGSRYIKGSFSIEGDDPRPLQMILEFFIYFAMTGKYCFSNLPWFYVRKRGITWLCICWR